MYDMNIDIENRQVLITKKVVATRGRKAAVIPIIFNEFDEIQRIFLENTADTYECELVLLDIRIKDEDGNDIGEVETKAFARRKDNPAWIMEFVPEEYVIE